MKYNERYDLVMFRDGILIYDTERDTYVNPKPFEFAYTANVWIKSYEENLEDADWLRSTQDWNLNGRTKPNNNHVTKD